MSIKLFCDICKKEIKEGNQTALPPRQNFLETPKVKIRVWVQIGIGEWGKGEVCISCTEEAVYSYLRGVGIVCNPPISNE